MERNIENDYMDIDPPYSSSVEMVDTFDSTPKRISLSSVVPGKLAKQKKDTLRNIVPGAYRGSNLNTLYDRLSRELSKLGGKLPRVNPPQLDPIIITINKEQDSIETKVFNAIIDYLRAESGSIATVVDFGKFLPFYQQDFYDPYYLIFMRKFLQGIVFHTDEEKDNKLRIRHWVNHLKVMASGSFGLTLSANIQSIGPFLAIKTPRIAGIDQRHEFLVGISLNPLREQNKTPAFVYTYDYFKCSPAKIPIDTKARGTPVRGWCGEGPLVARTNYVLIENIPNAMTLADFIYDDKLNITTFTSILFNILPSLHIANGCGFTHWDFHAGNCLIREIKEDSTIKYDLDGKPLYTKTFGYYPMIIDFGLSSYRAGNIYVGPNLNERKNTSCYFQGLPFPLADVYRILMSIYTTIVYDRMVYDSASNEEQAIVIALERMFAILFRDDIKFQGGEATLLNGLVKAKSAVIATKGQDDKAITALSAYNFYQLNVKYQSETIAVFLNTIVNRTSIINDMFEKGSKIRGEAMSLRDIISEKGDDTLLSCKGVLGVCTTEDEFKRDVEKEPRDYFEVDQYNIDVTKLPSDVQNDIYTNGIREATRLVDLAKGYIASINTAKHQTKKEVQAYTDDFVALWHYINELNLLLAIAKRYSYNVKVAKYIDETTKIIEKLEYRSTVDKVKNVVIDALKALNDIGSNDSDFKSELEATINLTNSL